MSRQRKPRAAVRRLSRGIEPRECTLIVCEGRKTEPKYMGKLRQRLRLSSAQVHVVPQGAAPITVVDRALEKRDERDRTKCNPSTDVYKLVEYLQDMAKRRPYP